MRKLDYHLYLQSAHWLTIRKSIRTRSQGWCERCKVNQQVDVHHVTYERLGFELPTDLVALCRDCHEYLHGKSEYDPASYSYSGKQIHKLRHDNERYWKHLVSLEPQLDTLYAQAANSFTNCLSGAPNNCPFQEEEIDPWYCSEMIWIDTLKTILLGLVGDYARVRDPDLISNVAYGFAYDKVYKAIPSCPLWLENNEGAAR